MMRRMRARLGVDDLLVNVHTKHLTEAVDTTAHAIALRDDRIRYAYRDGLSARTIADATGLTPGRVYQIVRADR